MGLDTVIVETLPDGSMDPKDLKLKLADNSNYPALVVATIGTNFSRFKGVIDQVDEIQKVLKSHQSYLHLDAALFGGYLPYIGHTYEVLQGFKGVVVNIFITAMDSTIKQKNPAKAISKGILANYYFPKYFSILSKARLMASSETQ